MQKAMERKSKNYVSCIPVKPGASSLKNNAEKSYLYKPPYLADGQYPWLKHKPPT